MSALANPAADQGSRVGRLAGRRSHAARLTKTDGFAVELVASYREKTTASGHDIPSVRVRRVQEPGKANSNSADLDG